MRYKGTTIILAILNILRYLLLDFGLQVTPQYQIDRYRVDFFIKPKYVVELDGPQHNFPTQKTADKARDKRLDELGYEVIRIPLILFILEPDEVLKNIAGISRQP